MTQWIGLGFVLAAVGLLAGLTLIKRKSPPAFREIAALTRLRRTSGMAVEDGTRIHISLGRGGLFSPQGAAGLAGLALLRQLSQQTSVSDRPPIVTSGDSTLGILSQDTLNTAYQAAGAADQFQPANGRVTGLTSFSYAAGAMPVIRGEQVSTNVVIGDLGPEVALLADAADRENAQLIGVTSELVGQAVLFASTSDPLVGEELFAMPAYTGDDPAQRASLQVEDVLRWLIILALLVGAGLKLVGLV